MLCWQKALPDEVIDDLVDDYLRAYVDWVQHYVDAEDDTEWALTLDTATGAVLDALHRARLSTRVHLLDSTTVVDGYRRRFAERLRHTAAGRRRGRAVTAAFAALPETPCRTARRRAW